MTISPNSPNPRRIGSSIRTQLLGGFGLILTLALAIALISYLSLQSLQTSIETNLEDATQIRELSLEIENEFLQARQAESNFLAEWRIIGFEEARTTYVLLNKSNLERARIKIAELELLAKSSSDPELVHILEDTTPLKPLLNTYETAFQAVVNNIEQRNIAEGPESKLNASLTELETLTAPIPNSTTYEVILGIRAEQQSFLFSGQRQYFDNILLLIKHFKLLIEIRSQLESPINSSYLLNLIEVYEDKLSGLVALDEDIVVNTNIFREVTVEINQHTSRMLQEGEDGFIRAKTQLQNDSNTLRLVLSIGSLVALGVGILAALLLARGIVMPIRKLSSTAQAFGQGDFSQLVEIKGGAELEALAVSFNTMANQIQELVSSLEERVDKRTNELEVSTKQSERRAAQLDAVAQVTRSISTTQDLNKLLPDVTTVISNQFGFYHVAIFLLDTNGDFAVLRASNSPGGQKMLERNHRLEVGGAGSVGLATSRGTAYIALDQGPDAIDFDNPDLPDTRSAISLPLIIDNQVIGALNVQSEEPDAFSQEDVSTLTTLADQVSIAIQNSRLFQETRNALAQTEVLLQQFTLEGWSHFTHTEKIMGIRRIEENSTILNELPAADDMNGDNTLDLPITLRGQKIGSLKMRASEKRKWTQDDIDIATSILERSAIALENARLLNEAQRRATRERTIGDISASISTFSDMEGILRTAVQQLGRKMGGADVVLELGTDFDIPEKGE